MNILEDLKDSIENGYPKLAEDLTQQALTESIPVQIIIDQGMLPAIRTIGESYTNNEVSIVRILSSARALRTSMDILRPHFQREGVSVLGTVILGTVEGDLHDVGKNLVGLMLSSSGFDVIDLGVDVSGKRFLQAIKEHPEVSIVCVSCLLTTTMTEMQRVVKTLNKSPYRNRFKIMVGGGSVTKKFALDIGADGYSDNAVTAVELAKTLVKEGSSS